MWKFIATTAFLLAACGTVQADETSDHVGIFGISIGKPLTLPRCADGPEATCIAKLDANNFELRFRDGTRPTWARQVFIVTREDVVKQLLIDTDSAQQQAIAEMLNAKYGKSEDTQTVVKQSRYALTPSIEATWHGEGFNVSFTGAESLKAGTLVLKSEDDESHDEEKR